MDIYNYHPATCEYIGPGKADPDPMQEGSYLVPAFATMVQPPQPGDKEAAVFSNGAWQLVADHRGTEYWLADRSRNIIDELGIEPPVDALFEQPPAPAADRRMSAKELIDAAAGKARGCFITTAPGQESTYHLKASEAAAYIAAGRPADAADYVMLTAEAEGRDMAVSDLADEILATRALWVQTAAQIEAIRITGKAAIDAASDGADFTAIVQPYIDQLAAMQP